MEMSGEIHAPAALTVLLLLQSPRTLGIGGWVSITAGLDS
jgi:hypothetical protein